MSATTTTKREQGRQTTGITKSKPSITMDIELQKAVKKAAFDEGVSFSAWIERAVRENLSAVVSKTEGDAQ